CKRNLKDVEQQVMVHIVFRVESCERKPGKLRKMSAFDRFPERLRPFDVVITVEIAAADGGGRELKPPEEDADDDGAGYKLNNLYGGLGFKLGGYAGRGRHQSLNRL